MYPAIVNSLVELGNNVQKFKALLSLQYWLNVRAAVINTRSYEEGLVAVKRLEELNLLYKKQNFLTELEYEEFQSRLFLFHLELLDKADLWDDFVRLFENLLQHRDVYKHTKIISALENSDIHPYVLGVDNQFAYIHPLWYLDYRYKIILKKVARKSKSKKVGNLQHKSQSELSEQEVQRRIMAVIAAADRGEYVPFSGYY